jgi:hypothetical protein
MIDRQQLESILARRFPGAPLDQIAAAANAIMGLNREAPQDRYCGSGGTVSGSRQRDEDDEVAPPSPSATA